jgi:hypothetical protein
MDKGKMSHAGCYEGPNLLDGLCPNCMAAIHGVSVPVIVGRMKTAEIIDWVCNDYPVHLRLVAILRGEDHYRGRRAMAAGPGAAPDVVRTAAVADFVAHLIDGSDDGSTYRSLYREAARKGHGGGYESGHARRIGRAVGGYALMETDGAGKITQPDVIDWDAVRAAVLRGEE